MSDFSGLAPIAAAAPVPAAEPAPRRGRDSAASRAAILHSAQKLFAERGFVQAGVRDIAADAGVNSALVGRYFGTKEQLFRAALETALDMTFLARTTPAELGRQIARIFSTSWDVPSPLRMMILSMADPDAHAVCAELIEAAIIAPLAQWLGGPDALDQARQLNMLWNGFLTGRELAADRAGRNPRGEAELRWLEEATQAIVDRGRPARP